MVGDGDGGDGDGEGVALCDPWLQDCPLDQKCVPATTEDNAAPSINKCVPVLGAGQPGDACKLASRVEATDDCGADSYCWNQDLGLSGECSAFCEGSSAEPSCAPGTTCVTVDAGAVWNLCVDGCDPVAQDCNMGEQFGCYIFDGDFLCAQSPSLIPLGEPCEYINDCAPGGVCIPGASLPDCVDAACCTAVCELDGAQCNALPGTQCLPLFEAGEAPFGFEDVGTCQLPT
ncbi:ribulose phosphate epimerase [Enhygromyxa salina]|uniref:Uncharacterized protein n=1 Tax=Enhygromyxa salina TaxID=215803 RepID=A0A2S9YPF9_9BACT|nr:ribulose phosphate epimerase [Enhygromyxa salina]PRQ06962.1 hypothetical protein ENSA7_33860 [Enhygromyxa salina]